MHRYCRAAWPWLHSDCAKCIGRSDREAARCQTFSCGCFVRHVPQLYLVLLIKRALQRRKSVLFLYWAAVPRRAGVCSHWEWRPRRNRLVCRQRDSPLEDSTVAAAARAVHLPTHTCLTPFILRRQLLGCTEPSRQSLAYLHELPASFDFGYRIGARKI